MHRSILALILLFCASDAWCQELKLIPAPRSLETKQGALALRSPVSVRITANNPEDRLAAETLVADLKAVHGLEATILTGGKAEVWIARVGSPQVDREITRRGLDRAAFENAEGYVLGVDASGILVAAKTAEGVFYGVQTLRQLIGADARVPAVAIADWPALRYRGLSVDISRGPVLTEEQMESLIRTAAEFKLNLLSFYMEHVFPYRHTPLVAPEGGEFGPELVKRLAAYAGRYHIELVPQQQTFGHLHYLLKHELYAGMAETPHGSVLAAEDEAALQWTKDAVTQLAPLSPSAFVHIGSDETDELGDGRSRELVQRVGLGEAYVTRMRKVTDMLRPLGKKLMFWGDIALKSPELIPRLPKDLVAMTWTYSPATEFDVYIKPFKDHGMEVFVCPGLNNWNLIFPAVSVAVTNINNFVRDGKKFGVTGMMNTHWSDDGETLFNMNWHGIVFGAAAAWQSGEVDTTAFDRAFDWAFYRNSDGGLVSVIRRLDDIHNLLRSTGLEGATDRLFWVEPFSRYGAETVRKAHPAASQVRLTAEKILVDLQAPGSIARAHPETIRFLRFAAKRLDALGMKIQFSREIADLYREALASQDDAEKVRAHLGRINGSNGLVQDLRDSTHELKALFRTAWLAENRPYWLDNVLIRYDSEALYWHEKSRLFTRAAQEYSATKVLPAAEHLGIHLP